MTIDQANSTDQDVNNNPAPEVTPSNTDPIQDLANEAGKTPFDSPSDEKLDFNLTVDGKQISQSYTKDELSALIQKGLAADERFRQAAEMRKANETKAEELERLLSEANDSFFTPTEEPEIDYSNLDEPELDGNDDISLLRQEVNSLKEQRQQEQLIAEAERELRTVITNHSIEDPNVVNEIVNFAAQHDGIDLETAFEILDYRRMKANPDSELSRRAASILPADKTTKQPTDTDQDMIMKIIKEGGKSL